MKERVQKLMATANIASRRASEELIKAGRVRVNGEIVELGAKADPLTDVITVDGETLKFETERRYFAVNKPVNVLSTNKPQKGDNRQTVRELLPYQGHLFTIGRLDAESEGLIVLTNDGELANQLTHPRFEHTKTYKVVVYGKPSQETLDTWERGVYFEDGRSAPCSIRVAESDHESTTLRIVMIEGKKRQIRRIAAALGHPVKRLVRTHIGMLAVGTLKRGEWIELGEEDVQAMQTQVSDLSYIRKLRKEAREKRRREFHQRVQTGQAPERTERIVRIPRENAAPRDDSSSEDRPRRRPFSGGPRRDSASSEDRPRRRPFSGGPRRDDSSSEDRPRRRPTGT
ncbi:MAG TPA: pseudouridine synthase, partial [Aggregatilineales bacterium]|nr:pseudouridine synthase [Aggregatilineales bacterium]